MIPSYNPYYSHYYWVGGPPNVSVVLKDSLGLPAAKCACQNIHLATLSNTPQEPYVYVYIYILSEIRILPVPHTPLTRSLHHPTAPLF